MTLHQSMLTEAIEDHLALKKQNASLADAMPLARYDVGDPLSRYPGGPARPAIGEEDTVVIPAAGGVVEGEFRRPLEPMSGMNPMLSLVEDVDEDDGLDDVPVAPTLLDDTAASIVRFPGGVGPRATDGDTALATTPSFATAVADATATGEQPVIVIDADEPLATSTDFGAEPMNPRRAKKSTFFNLRKRSKKNGGNEGGWFTGSPRDFDWND
jgi:hypothetical protein